MWNPIATAPKDRIILLWFPDGDFACRATWEKIEGGDEDGTGAQWAWIVPDDFSEQHDGIVWSESAQPTLWAEFPPAAQNQ